MLAAVVTMAVLVRVDPGGTPPALPPAIDPSVPHELGTWAVDVPKAPIARPAEHVGVWTGEALVVGFEEEVAAFDVASPTWRKLPDHPHGHAEGRQVVWTGREIVVIGGVWPMAHAAYDPSTDLWQSVPFPGTTAAQEGLWTDEQLIVFEEGGAPFGYVIHPGDDSSAALPDLITLNRPQP